MSCIHKVMYIYNKCSGKIISNNRLELGFSHKGVSCVKGGLLVKRIFILLFLSFSVITLVGCGDDEMPEEGEKIEEIEEEDEIGDGEIKDE